jgi:hypothetical protein
MEPLAFDEFSTFDTSVFKCSIELGSLYILHLKTEVSKVDYSLKAKGFNVRESVLFLIPAQIQATFCHRILKFCLGI